jgi:WD40 repeat protein
MAEAGIWQAQGTMSAAAAETSGVVHEPLGPFKPWPGLESYDEASEQYFKGRDPEISALLRLVQQAPLTLLYGKSGLGKSSLLKAGLFPKLYRHDHFLPVWLRLDLSPSARPHLMDQMLDRLLQELERIGAEFPAPPSGQSLWEYLHPAQPAFWSADNFAITPVLVFDQFEEVLAPGHAHSARVNELFNDLGNLVDNRIPQHLEADDVGPARAVLDMRSQSYRLVLSFRDDSLADLKEWERRIPSLGRDFLRLEPMSGAVAMDAVALAGKEVIAPGAERDIVEFVGRRDATAAASTDTMTIEPVLLSLCCSELNLRRPPGGLIDHALIEASGQDILDTFYRKALADGDVRDPPDVANFIETYLVQGDRFRGDFPVDEALKGLLRIKQLNALTGPNCRLLRVVQKADATRVELIHDRLVPVVCKARDARLAAAAAAKQELLADQARSDLLRAQNQSLSLKRQRNLSYVFAFLTIVASAMLLLWIKWANQADATARRTLDLADLAVSVASLGNQRMALRGSIDPWELTAQKALSAYRQSETDSTPALAKIRRLSLLGLSTYLQRHPHLRRILRLPGMALTPALAYSPDGKILAFGTHAGTIQLLDLQTQQVKGQLECGQKDQPVWSLAFNATGRRLAASHISADSGAGEGAVCVFDLAGGSAPLIWKVTNAQGKGAETYSVAFGTVPDGEIVASGGSDGTLRIWPVTSGRVPSVTTLDPSGVVAVAFSGDGRVLAAGTSNGAIWLVNMAAGRTQAPTRLEMPQHGPAHGATVQHLAFSPANPKLLVSTGDDGRIRAWNVVERCLVAQSSVQAARMYGVALSADNNLVASAGGDGVIRLMSLPEATCAVSNTSPKALPRTARELKPPRDNSAAPKKVPPIPEIREGRLSGHADLIYAVAFAPGGHQLVSAGIDGSLRFWASSIGGASVAELRAPASAGKETPELDSDITRLAISADSATIAAGDEQGNIHFWNAPPESADSALHAAAKRWEAHKGGVRALQFVGDGDGATLVSAGADGRIERWNRDGSPSSAPRFEVLPAKPESERGEFVALARSADSRHLAAGWSDGRVRIWDVRSGRTVRNENGPTAPPMGYALRALGFTGDGRYLAVAANGDESSDNFFVPVDPNPAAAVLRPALAEVGEFIAAFASGKGDAQWLASAGDVGGLVIWLDKALQPGRRGGGQQFSQKMRTGNPLLAMEISVDGALTLAAGQAGLVQLWDTADLGMLIGDQFSIDKEVSVKAIALAPDARYFLTAERRRVLVWPGPVRWADIVCERLTGNTASDQCPIRKGRR